MVGAGGDPVGDRAHKLDTTILSTLAHLGCASFEQLHALCFPNAVLATARLKLNALISAGLIAHSPWRLPSRNRHSGHVWTMTQQGLERFQQHAAPPSPIPDMGRPSTAREYEEWRVRLLVRTFVVRLILEARQDPVCANLDVSFSLTHPTPLGPLYPAQPDALLAIVWQPAQVQPPDWLPWPRQPGQAKSGTRYPVHIERQGNVASLDQLIERSIEQQAVGVPLVILTNADRYRIAHDLLRHRSKRRPIRMTHWNLLQTSIDGPVWRDMAGTARTLRLGDDEKLDLEEPRQRGA